jgi:hypothetical protein
VLAIPEPESGIDNGEFVAVLATDMVPLKLPDAVGANAALKLAVCPGARVTGVARLLTLK